VTTETGENRKDAESAKDAKKGRGYTFPSLFAIFVSFAPLRFSPVSLCYAWAGRNFGKVTSSVTSS
jgi:hypothetical protein